MSAETIQLSPDTAAQLIIQLNQIGLWIKAAGAIVFLWLVWYAIIFAMNRKRLQALRNIENDLKRIERKIDKLENKK